MIELRDTRLVLARPDGGSVRVSIVNVDVRRFVELGRFDAERQLRSAVRVVPEELDRLGETLRDCRCGLLGAPDPREDARRVQEAAGLQPRRRGR